MTKWTGRRSILAVASLLLIAALAGATVRPGDGSQGPEVSEIARGDSRVLRLLVPFLPEEIEGLSAGRWNGKRLEILESAVEEHAAKSVIRVATRCGGGATLQVMADRWIARPVSLSAAVCDAEVIELEGLPAATLRGRVSVPRGEVLPGFGRLEVARCPAENEKNGELLGEFPARFDDKEGWFAQVPAGCLDVTLSVSPFAPARWSAVAAEQGEEIEVPAVALVRGANLTALVLAPESGLGIAGASVSLVSETEFESVAEAAYAGRTVAGERWQRSDAQGWVRFEGVPPGIYYLIAQSNEGRGRAPGFSRAVELTAGEEVVVDRLALPEPTSLRIGVEPKEDSDLPDGKLNARAVPILGSTTLAHSVRDIEFGVGSPGVFQGLVPGSWRVSVRWKGPHAGSTFLGEEEIVLAPGSSEALSFELDIGVFHGRVTYRDQPLSGTLTLYPAEERFERSSPGTQSDDDGRFSVLTDPGRYTVHFRQAGGQPASSVIPEVRFEDPDELIEVELPDGRMEGVVVDAEGEPVARAVVTARGVRTGARVRLHSFADFLQAGTRTGPDGRFVLEALGEGTWTLVAKAGQRRSEPVVTELARDQYLPGLELVVGETVPITVTVVDESGQPVQGAGGSVALPPSRPWELMPGKPVRTDSLGRSELRVRPTLQGRAATISLGAPGHARTVVRATVAREIQVLLPLAFGRLELIPEESWGPSDYVQLAFVSATGAGVMLHDLISVGRGIDAGVPFPGSENPAIIPDLAPGTWRLVRSSGTYAEGIALLDGQGHRLPTLATFTVVAGATTQVEVPSEEQRRGRQDRDRDFR